ncbi:MAG TPA: hypothetical protein VG273_09150 [Bryobacteraceae bacterium]|jgi:hypothetical protein|nr:hypothetical protein [Bryobacteraceae bacterium]
MRLLNVIAALVASAALLTATPAATSPTVTLANVTGGGATTFFDGDGFAITLSGGAPNSPITVTRTRNGAVVSVNSSEGNTDGKGAAAFSGFVLGSDAGSWTEAWSVGGVPAAQLLRFTINKINATPILTPDTPPHPYYRFNASSAIDATADVSALPHFFRAADALSDPPAGTLRGACSLVTNPGVGYIPSGAFSWFFYNPPGPATGTVLAVPGEYMEAPRFSYNLAYQTAGFAFNGEFIGQGAAPQTANQSYVEAAYVSDRACYDGGTEWGWYHAPAISNGGISANQPPNVLIFYYSEFTNCHGNYECEYPDGTQVQQSSNYYTVTLNAPNAAGTYQFDFEVFRTNADFGSGLVSNFVLSITDPQTGDPALCSVVQSPPETYPDSRSMTSVAFTRPGYCSEVFVGIDGGWFPPPSVTNTGYVTFTDGSNPYLPESWFYNGSPAGNTPPASNVVPTIYPNGKAADAAGLNVISASELFVNQPRFIPHPVPADPPVRPGKVHR